METRVLMWETWGNNIKISQCSTIPIYHNAQLNKYIIVVFFESGIHASRRAECHPVTLCPLDARIPLKTPCLDHCWRLAEAFKRSLFWIANACTNAHVHVVTKTCVTQVPMSTVWHHVAYWLTWVTARSYCTHRTLLLSVIPSIH